MTPVDEDEGPVAGPAYRYEGPDGYVAYQVEGMGPGAQYEVWPEGSGWFVYTHPDDEDADDGPLTEAEALDWLWHHPPQYGVYP